MLANKLKSLLAERNLTIKQTIKDTGLSRNTLSNIINNPTSNISLSTLNTLCIYLGITTNDFYSFVPFDFEYNIDINFNVLNNDEDVIEGYPGHEHDCSAFIKVVKNNQLLANIEFDGTIEIFVEPVSNTETYVTYSVALNYANPQEQKNFQPFSNQLSINLKSVIKDKLMEKFDKAVKSDVDGQLRQQNLSINLN